MERQTIIARAGIKEIDLFKRLVKSRLDPETCYKTITEAKDNKDCKLPDSQTIIIYQQSLGTFTIIGPNDYPELMKPVDREDYMSPKEIKIMDYQFKDGTKFTLNELSMINDCRHQPNTEYGALVIKLIDELLRLEV